MLGTVSYSTAALFSLVAVGLFYFWTRPNLAVAQW